MPPSHVKSLQCVPPAIAQSGMSESYAHWAAADYSGDWLHALRHASQVENGGLLGMGHCKIVFKDHKQGTVFMEVRNSQSNPSVVDQSVSECLCVPHVHRSVCPGVELSCFRPS